MDYSNPEYFAYAKKMEPRIKKKLSHEFEQIHTTGIESVKALPENASILYTPLHKSHMDYIMLLANTFSHDLPFPRVVSGNNLLSGFTSAFIKHVARLDFAALGTISIPRARPKPPQRGAYDEFDQFRKAEQEYADSLSAHENETTEFQTSFTSGLENEVIALFPEARERETHNQKTGRTYTGLERNFSPLFAREAVKHENLYIVPLAITYDWVPETHLFHKLNIAKSRGNSRAYQKLEAQTFLRTLWKGGKGDV